MGFLSTLLGSAGGGLIKNVADTVDRFVETPSESNAHELKKMALEMQSQLQQIEVNKVEAQHASVLVAAWRPFVGWVCGGALAYTYIIQPFATFAILIWQPDFPSPPSLSTGDLMPVLLGMLGLGGMRSFEKTKGVARGSIKEGESRSPS